MPNIDSEIGAKRSQFVYHNFFENNGESLTTKASQIKEEGLWSPVDYSIISPDIFFFGGGVPETVTVICATPHQKSDEFVGERHPWKRVRLMEPVGKVYPLEDEAIPARVKKIFAEKSNTESLVKKGFRHIPPPDLKAIIEWGDEGRMFRYACGEGLHQYISGQTELEAVAQIEYLSLKISMPMEILDHNLGREEVITGIAKSVTKLSLTERNEEVLQALADLEMGNVERVNDYLSPYYRDIDTFACNLDGKENVIIRDEKELLRRIRERINQVVSMQPSYPDTKRVRGEYLIRIFSEISG